MPKIKKGTKVGLALGGGAVLGAAHIGALKALKELGIEIAYISGTSIGGLIASLYAFDVDHEKVKNLAIDLSWGDITSFSSSMSGLLSNDKMRDFVEEHIGNVDFDAAKIPLALVATNISNGEKMVLKKGNVADAVIASACIPGIFQPIEIDGELLVDGGIVENVPISPLYDFGAEVSIAIDLNAQHTYKRPENIVDVMLNSFHFTLAATAKLQTKKADILILPDLSSFNRLDMNQTEALIQKGYEETLKIMNKNID